MGMENERAVIGGNNPPDPIDEAVAPFSDEIAEAQNWADGTLVENAEQLEAIDKILPVLRTAGTKIDAARLEATKPLRDAVAAENLRWKPTIDDVERLKKCLVNAAAPYREKLAAEKEEERKQAAIAAANARREAEEAAKAANAADVEAQREAAAKLAEAKAATEASNKAAKDTVKGMRTVTRYTLDDERAALHWIARNDRPAMAAFIADYVQRNHKAKDIDGVTVTTSKEAY
jgi:hypothetical protein